MTEEWRDVVGYEGLYQVSNLGRVRSIRGVPKILKQDSQRNGYKRVYLWKGKKKNMLVHRLVAKSFVDNPEGLNEINHLDENKENNTASNLQWCTHLENMRYGSVREKIGRAHRGRIASPETRRKHSIDSSNRRWVHNGQRERFVSIHIANEYIRSGWYSGRLKKEEIKECLNA